MITYVNIGPGRSGTTSFYNMCLNHKLINCGKNKDPIEKVKEGFNMSQYIKNWDLNTYSNNILLDGSGHLIFYHDLYEFKNYISKYVNDYKFILLVRNPKLYCVSKIFINFLYEIEEEFGFNINTNLVLKSISKLSLHDIINKINLKFKDNSYIEKYSYLRVIKNAEKIYNKNKIFILPIISFNDYKLKLSEFVNIDFSESILLNIKTDPIIMLHEKFKTIKLIIKLKIYNDKILDLKIKEDFRIIDNEYGSNLYNLYIN